VCDVLLQASGEIPDVQATDDAVVSTMNRDAASRVSDSARTRESRTHEYGPENLSALALNSLL
jgi:hypothetical protein